MILGGHGFVLDRCRDVHHVAHAESGFVVCFLGRLAAVLNVFHL